MVANHCSKLYNIYRIDNNSFYAFQHIVINASLNKNLHTIFCHQNILLIFPITIQIHFFIIANVNVKQSKNMHLMIYLQYNV